MSPPKCNQRTTSFGAGLKPLSDRPSTTQTASAVFRRGKASPLYGGSVLELASRSQLFPRSRDSALQVQGCRPVPCNSRFGIDLCRDPCKWSCVLPPRTADPRQCPGMPAITRIQAPMTGSLLGAARNRCPLHGIQQPGQQGEEAGLCLGCVPLSPTEC